MPQSHVLETLYQVIQSRRDADPDKSNTARLFAKGKKKIAQKLGEEAVECALAAVDGGREQVIAESADLLFHLMILWADRGVRPAEIYAELARREGVSGLSEKASRKRD